MPEIEWLPSPWHSKGWWDPPTNIAMHSTATTLAGTLATFGPGSTRRVSAHFTLDGASGRIIQHVSLDDRAWHAVSANDFAYGVETVDGRPWGDHPDPATYELAAWLLDYISEQHYQRYSVALPINDSVVRPHSDYVQTACPANLDWPRCIEEAGGPMPEYVGRGEFEAYQQNVRESFESVKAYLVAHATDVRDSFNAVKSVLHTHTHDAPAKPLGFQRPPKLALIAPPLPRKRTAARARAGHGRGDMKGDVK